MKETKRTGTETQERVRDKRQKRERDERERQKRNKREMRDESDKNESDRDEREREKNSRDRNRQRDRHRQRAGKQKTDSGKVGSGERPGGQREVGKQCRPGRPPWAPASPGALRGSLAAAPPQHPEPRGHLGSLTSSSTEPSCKRASRTVWWSSSRRAL